MQRDIQEWRVKDMKTLAVIVKLLSPTYQTMVREAQSAFDAWEILRAFFARQNLHSRVQLRKQLHAFELESAGDLMKHLMRFEELCIRLTAIGDQSARRRIWSFSSAACLKSTTGWSASSRRRLM